MTQFCLSTDERIIGTRCSAQRRGIPRLLIIFGNRKNRQIVNRTQHFLGICRTGRVSIYSICSTSESGIAGRAEIAGIVGDRFRWALDFYSGIE